MRTRKVTELGGSPMIPHVLAYTSQKVSPNLGLQNWRSSKTCVHKNPTWLSYHCIKKLSPCSKVFHQGHTYTHSCASCRYRQSRQMKFLPSIHLGLLILIFPKPLEIGILHFNFFFFNFCFLLPQSS